MPCKETVVLSPMKDTEEDFKSFKKRYVETMKILMTFITKIIAPLMKNTIILYALESFDLEFLSKSFPPKNSIIHSTLSFSMLLNLIQISSL